MGLEALAAYRLAGASDDTNVLGPIFACLILYSARLFTVSEENAAAIRAAAPSIRFLMDNPQVFMA